jgi:hypothetical protein
LVAAAQNAGMGEIVNLRRMKQSREREAAAAAARENRIRHGRTKVEKANDDRAEERRRALLDGSKRGDATERTGGP